MPTMKHIARRGLQRMGVDVQRFPECDPSHQTAKLLRHHAVELVLDVGANDGGYASSLRRHGYRGRIISFEPLPVAFEDLTRRSRNDELWTCKNIALGPRHGSATLNIAGNSGASSSVLPMLRRHRDAAPDSSYVDTCVIAMHRLDDVLEAVDPGPATHLKIDVQGYERHVLQGASQLLGSRHLVGLQLELSLVDLYEGGMGWRQAVDLAENAGFRLEGLQPGFTDKQTGQLLQADGLFFR